MERISRQDLYVLVWAEPMIKVATRFGISGVALAKACRKLDIPVPHRGYWAKAQTGKRVTQLPLPPRKLGGVDTVELGRKRWDRYSISDDDLIAMEIPPPHVFPESLEELTARVERMVGKVAIPKDLSKPHHWVAKLLEEDAARKKESSSYFSRALFGSPFEQRRLRLVNGLFVALNRLGMHCSLYGKDPESFDVRVGDQHVSFTVDGLGKTQRSGYRTEFELRRPSSETLQLRIDSHLKGMEAVPHLWQDKPGEPIEKHARAIVVALIVSGEMEFRLSKHWQHEHLIQSKARAIEAKRKREEEERRQARERQIRAERARVKRLLGEAAAYRQANTIRAYVESVRAVSAASADITPEQLEQWSAWAIAQADRIDPVRSLAFLRGVDGQDDSADLHESEEEEVVEERSPRWRTDGHDNSAYFRSHWTHWATKNRYA